jgi:ubiquinone/menaquinone biosynthesis C-methylase UbiE
MNWLRQLFQGGSNVCPVSHAGLLGGGYRRLLQNPDRILARMIRDGETVADLGCGPGFFAEALARAVGEHGQVILVDLQQGMLDLAAQRLAGTPFEGCVRTHLCSTDRIGIEEPLDFALVFYMLHEVPDPKRFLQEAHDTLKPGGRLLLVEPKFHVFRDRFRREIEAAESVGFRKLSEPAVFLSRTALLARGSGAASPPSA